MLTMSEKIKKTLYLPDWVADLLDREGERMDGPGFMAAAAIFNFCGLTNDEKKAALSQYKQAEIERAYAVQDEQDAAQSADEEQKRKRGQRPSKAG